MLGKRIGVCLGRPIEGRTYGRILAELGPIEGYANERLGLLLIVTLDDLSGTFTFVRALADPGYGRGLTPAQIGFDLPGAVQGFQAEGGPGALRLRNVPGHSAEGAGGRFERQPGLAATPSAR